MFNVKTSSWGFRSPSSPTNTGDVAFESDTSLWRLSSAGKSVNAFVSLGHLNGFSFRFGPIIYSFPEPHLFLACVVFFDLVSQSVNSKNSQREGKIKGATGLLS